ncbi:hypothetical protein AMTRI_Chr01g132040 [Amborella trichopoda]
MPSTTRFPTSFSSFEVATFSNMDTTQPMPIHKCWHSTLPLVGWIQLSCMPSSNTPHVTLPPTPPGTYLHTSSQGLPIGEDGRPLHLKQFDPSLFYPLSTYPSSGPALPCFSQSAPSAAPLLSSPSSLIHQPFCPLTPPISPPSEPHLPSSSPRRPASHRSPLLSPPSSTPSPPHFPPPHLNLHIGLSFSAPSALDNPSNPSPVAPRSSSFTSGHHLAL